MEQVGNLSERGYGAEDVAAVLRGLDADITLKLVEAVRALAKRHGPAAVDHCVKMVTDLNALLNGLTT